MQALNLTFVLIGNSMQRIAVGASGVLIGFYLAHLANRGSAIGAGLVGILGAVSFGAELVSLQPRSDRSSSQYFNGCAAFAQGHCSTENPACFNSSKAFLEPLGFCE